MLGVADGGEGITSAQLEHNSWRFKNRTFFWIARHSNNPFIRSSPYQKVESLQYRKKYCSHSFRSVVRFMDSIYILSSKTGNAFGKGIIMQSMKFYLIRARRIKYLGFNDAWFVVVGIILLSFVTDIMFSRNSFARLPFIDMLPSIGVFL